VKDWEAVREQNIINNTKWIYDYHKTNGIATDRDRTQMMEGLAISMKKAERLKREMEWILGENYRDDKKEKRDIITAKKEQNRQKRKERQRQADEKRKEEKRKKEKAQKQKQQKREQEQKEEQLRKLEARWKETGRGRRKKKGRIWDGTKWRPP
jgi:hypothetical protein